MSSPERLYLSSLREYAATVAIILFVSGLSHANSMAPNPTASLASSIDFPQEPSKLGAQAFYAISPNTLLFRSSLRNISKERFPSLAAQPTGVVPSISTQVQDSLVSLPEPSAGILLSIGLLGLYPWRRKIRVISKDFQCSGASRS